MRKFVRKMNTILKSGKNKYKKEIRYESIIRIMDAYECFPDLPEQYKKHSFEIRQSILKLTQVTLS